MAKVDVICPHCQAEQSLPDRRLTEPWVCMKCRGTIDDPYLHKKKSAPPKLAIPLHGKIISPTGITNLSEITAASEEYSQGFDPSSVVIPGKFNLEARAPAGPVYVEHKRNRLLTILIGLIFALVIIGALVAFYWLVIRKA